MHAGLKFMLFGFSLVMFAFSSTPAFAISPNAIFVDVAPQNPGPNENVTITLRSFLANLDTVTISWFVNGRASSSGIGQKTFSTAAGSAGSEVKIEARIALPDGEIRKNVTLRPSEMILLWQANDAYTPPFYKGKAMPTTESEVKIVAIPEIRSGGTTLNPKNLAYFWQKDYNNMAANSGYGKNAFIYVNDYLDDVSTITATAQTTDQRFTSEGSVTVGTYLPKISFYKKTPEFGTVWEKTLEDPHLVNESETVVAIPYFLSPKDIRLPDLTFNWSINGRTITNPNFQRNTIPLQVAEGATGISKLRLDISNRFKIFQTLSKELTIEF